MTEQSPEPETPVEDALRDASWLTEGILRHLEASARRFAEESRAKAEGGEL